MPVFPPFYARLTKSNKDFIVPSKNIQFAEKGCSRQLRTTKKNRQRLYQYKKHVVRLLRLNRYIKIKETQVFTLFTRRHCWILN